MPTTALFHITRSGKQFGPFTSKQLRELAANGKLHADDLVAEVSGGKSTRADRIAGLILSKESKPPIPEKAIEEVPLAPPTPPTRKRRSLQFEKQQAGFTVHPPTVDSPSPHQISTPVNPKSMFSPVIAPQVTAQTPPDVNDLLPSNRRSPVAERSNSRAKRKPWLERGQFIAVLSVVQLFVSPIIAGILALILRLIVSPTDMLESARLASGIAAIVMPCTFHLLTFGIWASSVVIAVDKGYPTSVGLILGLFFPIGFLAVTLLPKVAGRPIEKRPLWGLIGMTLVADIVLVSVVAVLFFWATY